MSVNQIDINADNERRRRIADYNKVLGVTPAQVKKEVDAIKAEKKA